MPVYEASSGSTAVSEAYFARMLGLQFTAVMSKTVSKEKIQAIEFYGGRAALVESSGLASIEAARMAAESGGYFFNQFLNAERATDWRGNNNIGETIFSQMARERFPEPSWIVVSAGKEEEMHLYLLGSQVTHRENIRLFQTSTGQD
jgi:cysteine synthase A